MKISREQTETIIRNGKSKGMTGQQVLDGLIQRGYEPEGIDVEQAKSVMAQTETAQVPEEQGKTTFKERVSETADDFKQIGNDILDGSGKRAEKIAEIKDDLESGQKGDVTSILEVAGQLAGAGSDAIGAAFKGVAKIALSPRTEEKIKEVTETLGAKVMATPKAKQAMNWYNSLPDEKKDALDAAGGAVSLISEFVGLGSAKKGVTVAKEAVDVAAQAAKDAAVAAKDIVVEGAEAVGKQVKTVAGDVIPAADRVVNSKISKALDLTQGDIKNISKSTGNEVGEFIADNNLIGANKKATKKNIDDFFKKNYDAVREEIDKVTTVYTPDAVPRYQESLKAIKKKITDVLGLENANKEIDELLGKTEINLKDVQRVKELMDEHFSLYKVTGDVKEGIEKDGLSKIREEMREFIESEVKNATGSDIMKMNNNVRTARSISMAIADRSTRGLTRANLRMGDLWTFGAGSVVGSPLFGLALVAAKKIVESPSIGLRWAKYLDIISDARKIKIKNQMEKGIVPKEVEAIIKESQSEIDVK